MAWNHTMTRRRDCISALAGHSNLSSIAFGDPTVDVDARHPRTAPVAQNARDCADPQLRPLRLGGAHQGGRELTGMHLSRGAWGGQLLGEGNVIRSPAGLVGGAAMTCLGADETGIGGQGTVAP